MASLAEVNAAVAQLTQAVAAERAEVQGKLGDLSAQIQALKDQLAQGQTVTPADLDAVVAAIAEINSGIQQISEPAA